MRRSWSNKAACLAEQGDIAGAVAKFTEALALDSNLTIEPDVEAKRIYASKLVEQGPWPRGTGRHRWSCGEVHRSFGT